MKHDNFREHFSSQPTDQLLFLKDRGGLIDDAMIALDLVLTERNISVPQLEDAKKASNKKQGNIKQNKSGIVEFIKTEILLGIFYLNI